MDDEVQDVAGASSTPDVTADSSPAEQVQETQQPEVQQPVEEQRVPLERFQSIVQEKKQLQAEKEQLLAMLQRPVQVVQPQAPPQKADLWAGKLDHPDPATARFWHEQKQIFDSAVEQGEQRAVERLQPVIQAGMARLAEMDIRDFRRSNPDIKPNSEQEQAIVAYMNGHVDGLRHTLESAKRNALFDSLQEENRVLKSKQQVVPKKVAAAQVESSAGIPQVSGMPKPVQTTSDVVRDVIRQGGNMRDAAARIFG